MKELHFRFIVLLAWFSLVFNVERLSDPINIASFVYVLTAAVAILVILLSRYQQISLVWLLIIPLPLFFALKIWLGYPIAGRYLPITVTEMAIIEITVILAGQVGWGLAEFRQAVTSAITSHLKNNTRPFDDGQAEMYREVRRARTQQRPLTLFTIFASAQSVNLSIDRFTEEIRQEIIKKYISARIASFLSQEMSDYDIIAQRGDHFLTMLPGVDRDGAFRIAQRLQQAAQEKLGLTLTIGMSTFPEEVTFEKLVERAEAEVRQAAAAVDQQLELLNSGRAAVTQQREDALLS